LGWQMEVGRQLVREILIAKKAICALMILIGAC
jgi:hypothetical protein